MSILPMRMPSGTWIQPNKRRPGRIMQLSEEGTGDIYAFEEEPLALGRFDGFGYYPACLGHAFSSEFLTIRKLGWSNSSTVWIGQNLAAWQIEAWGSTTVLPNKFYAIKVKTSHASSLPSYESDCYEAITARRESPGLRHCLPLIRSHYNVSTEGIHRYFMTSVTGPDLMKLASKRLGLYPIPAVKRILRQTLLALEHIHASGFLHGDLKPDNIVVSLPDGQTDKLVEEALAKSPSETYPASNVPYLSDQPIVTVKSQPLDPVWLDDDLGNLDIQLVDYGHAIPLDKTHDAPPNMQLEVFRSPEVTLGHPISKEIDIWSLGCIAVYLLIGTHFFENPMFHDPADGGRDARRLCRTIEFLGRFSESFLARCSRRDELLDEHGVPRGVFGELAEGGRALVTSENMPRTELETILRPGLSDLGERELSEVCGFVRRCLTVDPAHRPSASGLLEDPWLAE
ncbi:hypothetical protein LshimejAT787_0101340 [Lyophyllum shimeji]|uniref:Protein kinase domain-containing protein n=1 Tax=Lyophyllum shimeji TaxID=47721 RepID=A0A9P3UJE7_LYOSH|nr:hypothetical protein LshimejAT787_0101340 [Lyophyllum shimeji]